MDIRECVSCGRAIYGEDYFMGTKGDYHKSCYQGGRPPNLYAANVKNGGIERIEVGVAGGGGADGIVDHGPNIVYGPPGNTGATGIKVGGGGSFTNMLQQENARLKNRLKFLEESDYGEKNRLKKEVARLKELNREMVEVLKYVCVDICDEQHKEECPDGYSRNCDVLKILAKAEGEE